jgi:hypothetical protein
VFGGFGFIFILHFTAWVRDRESLVIERRAKTKDSDRVDDDSDDRDR